MILLLSYLPIGTRLPALSRAARGGMASRLERSLVVYARGWMTAEYDLPIAPHPMKLRRAAVAAALVGAISLILALWAERLYRFDLRTELVSALGGFRPVEGRLAGFPAAPYLARVPAAGAPTWNRFVRSLNERVGRHPSREAFIDAALLRIASREWEQATGLLSEAAAAGGQDARIWNDLAVVHLERGAENRDPQHLILALSVIERAVRVSPAQAEAAFNRALILERLGLRRHARDAWQRYLDLDRTSPWASEAETRLAALTADLRAGSPEVRQKDLQQALLLGQDRRAEALPARFAQPVRVHLETVLLADWGRAIRRGSEAEAEHLAQVASAIARGLSKISGDRLPAEATAAIREAEGSKLQALAEAHLAFGEAYRLYREDATAQARLLFVEARDLFLKTGSPFQEWAEFYIASCDYREERTAAATSALSSLTRRAAGKSHLNLAGMSEWLLGLMALEKASPGEALDHFRTALADFERTRESGNQGSIVSLIANCLEYVGEPGEAWRHRYLAIQATIAAGNRERFPAIYGAAARALMKRKDFSTALAFQDEGLAFALTKGDPRILAEAFWWRAMILHEAGRDGEASRAIVQAHSWSEKIAHPPTRLRTLAGLSVTEGAILRAASPQKAVVALSRALDLYRQVDYSYLLVDIYLERARSFLGIGNFAQAEADLTAGLTEFERQRKRIMDPQLKASYFERAQEVVEQLIAFQVDRRKDPDRAFDVFERSKARTLLDLASRAAMQTADTGAGAPISADVLRKKLPPGTFLLQYAVLPERVLAWTFRSGGSSFHQIPLDRKALESLSRRFVSAARDAASPADLSGPAEAMFRAILKPLLADLPAQSPLVIIPDKLFTIVPFHGLRDPGTGLFLIERNPLATAPSASVYLRTLAHAGSMPAARQRAVMAVGNPAFDRAAHRQLFTLPAAEREARWIAARYGNSLALVGAEATKPRFLSLLNRYDLVHYSGHAVHGTVAPLIASLVLAPGDKHSSGDLDEEEIRRLRLTRPRLVVLAACGTAVGRQRSLEGVSHLAHAFLAAGIPSVLANLWNVDDQAAQTFFATFYGELDAGRPPISALQVTQARMIRSPDPALRKPSTWAGFQFIGAASSVAFPERGIHGQTLRRSNGSPGAGSSSRGGAVGQDSIAQGLSQPEDRLHSDRAASRTREDSQRD